MNVRIKWLRNQLVSLNLDGMIVSNPINVRYLTGLSEEGILIIAPKENIFVTDGRYIEYAHKVLTIFDEITVYDMKDLSQDDYENFFLFCENVGFEESYVTYAKYKEYMYKFQNHFFFLQPFVKYLFGIVKGLFFSELHRILYKRSRRSFSCAVFIQKSYRRISSVIQLPFSSFADTREF